MKYLWTGAVLAVVLSLECSGHDRHLFNLPDTGAASSDELLEWAYGEIVYEYAQDSSFALLSFSVPINTLKAQFEIIIPDSVNGELNRTVDLLLRRGGIPVLNAYDEAVPESFVIPTDQRTYHLPVNTDINLTLNSPTPGRVYMLASVLNSLSDVIDHLRWEEPLPGPCSMAVKAIYTLRTSVTSLPTDEISEIVVTAGRTNTFSFWVPAFTTDYSVVISSCHGSNNESNCPVTMTVADSLASGDTSSVSVDCLQKGQSCQLTIASPLVESENYVTFSLDDGSGASNVTFDVSFQMHDCAAMVSTYRLADDMTTVLRDAHLKGLVNLDRTANPGPGCFSLGRLGRANIPGSDSSFEANFARWTVAGDSVTDFDVIVHDFSVEVLTFTLQDAVDTGGILYITAVIRDPDWTGIVWLCAMAQRVPQNDSLAQCETGAVLTLNNTAVRVGDQQRAPSLFLPFPTSGSWYLAMQGQCWGSSGPKPCEELPMITMEVGMTQCPPNQCGDFGTCQLYMEATTVFAGCRCYVGYRGLACNDGSYALTDEEQLRAVYLLTLSNLAFLPAIFLALYRRFFTLAAIFFFNCFFSAFYHACDASHVSQFQLCILNYSTLAFCDFFGSVLSFYSVLLFMARIAEAARTFLLMSGALVIAVFQNSDRHGDLGHILPVVTAGLVLLVSWLHQMHRRRRLFPSKRRYLLFILPGIALALTGIGVNYGLNGHKSLYQYTHSFWHISLMVCPCFLMPPRPRGLSGSNKDLSISAQDIISVGHQQQQQSRQQAEDDEPAMFDASMNSVDADQNLLI